VHDAGAAVPAIVLGSIAEPTVCRSLLFSDGDLSIFFTGPVSGPIAITVNVLILLPVVKSVWSLVQPSRKAPSL